MDKKKLELFNKIENKPNYHQLEELWEEEGITDIDKLKNENKKRNLGFTQAEIVLLGHK